MRNRLTRTKKPLWEEPDLTPPNIRRNIDRTYGSKSCRVLVAPGGSWWVAVESWWLSWWLLVLSWWVAVESWWLTAVLVAVLVGGCRVLVAPGGWLSSPGGCPG